MELSQRALNRATLERQLLLRRSDMSVLDTIEHLVGVQAQEPQNPYTALWSRLERFRPAELSELLLARKVVRIHVMRGTLHLVSADDALLLRPLTQPVLDGQLKRHGVHGAALRGVDLGPVLRVARPLLEARPRTGRELRAALAEHFPKEDAAALAEACRHLLPLVQVPPRGLWGQAAQVRSTTAESWLGSSLASNPSVDDVMIRYVAAFGPASVADAATWSRLTGLREVFERLRPRLRTFRDERGRELFDLPDAPRPDPETPAPTRFLPEYDNVLLSHADRSRFYSQSLAGLKGRIHGTVLHDGFVCGVWRLDREQDAAMLVITHGRLSKRTTASVAAEGRRFLRFMASDARGNEVRLAAAS